MPDERDIYNEVRRLAQQVDRIQEKLDYISREMGARDGAVLAQQVDTLTENVGEIRQVVKETKLDTMNLRKVEDYGSRDIEEIKKALAAIYKLLSEMHAQTKPPGFNTFQ